MEGCSAFSSNDDEGVFCGGGELLYWEILNCRIGRWNRRIERRTTPHNKHITKNRDRATQ